MGIIAGVLYPITAKQGLKHVVSSMVSVQRHRDSSPIVACFGDNYAFAMANKHNDIYNESPVESGDDSGDIFVMLDGVVLDVPKHRSYFEQKGHRTSVPTCTAIIEAAYREWGTDFMRHLEGEFSCVIWDKRKKLLVLARDPYGHKPLHYYADAERYVFSSEMKGVLAAGVTCSIDMLSLSDFLSLNCVPSPSTIAKGIRQVQPGTMLIVSAAGIQEKRYWYPKQVVNKNLDIVSATEQLSGLLNTAVKKRMVSKPAYCFLSGGIDSSAIVSFAAEHSEQPINAISISFDEKEFDELEYAKAMAEHVGAHLHHVVAKPNQFFDMLDTLVHHHDSPFTDTSAYPTYYAGKLGRQFTDIILTGDGPDQTLGGSDHHVFAVRNNLFREAAPIRRKLCGVGAALAGMLNNHPAPSVLSKLRRSWYRKSLTPIRSIYELRSYWPSIVKDHVCSEELQRVHALNDPYRHPESWFRDAEGLDDINKYLYADIQFYITDDLMIKVDRMCMAHGLETLSPFQDMQLGRFVLGLPGSYKLHESDQGEFTTKYILKRVCEKRFPEKVLAKRKQGFGIPLEKWLKQNNGAKLKEILLDDRTLNRGCFNRKALTRLVHDFVTGRSDYFYGSPFAMVGLVTLELWHRAYIDRKIA